MLSRARKSAGTAAAAISVAATVAGTSVSPSDVKTVAKVIGSASAKAAAGAKDAAAGAKDWAAAKALVAGSEGYKLALAALKERVIATSNQDFWDALVAIDECEEKVMKEIAYKSKFGLMFALPLLRLDHEARRPPISRGLVVDRDLIEEVSHWLVYADAAYGSRSPDVAKADAAEKISKKLGAKAVLYKDIAYLPTGVVGEVQCPGYFIAVDVEKTAVVLGIRGTVNIADAITDAVGHSVEVPECPGVEVHQGILASARAVLRETRDALSEALEAFSESRIHVCGHSLGAGVAIICTLLLNASPLPAKPQLRCFAYAPPPVVSTLTAPSVAELDIMVVVNRHDIVPRLCMHNILMLGLEAAAVDQLSLGIRTRLALAQSGSKSRDEASKSKVIAAIAEGQARGQARSSDEGIPPHYTPGKILWIDWQGTRLGRASDDGSEEREASTIEILDKALEGTDAPPARLHVVDYMEFQKTLVRGGSALVMDHKIGQYAAGLEAVKVSLFGKDGRGGRLEKAERIWADFKEFDTDADGTISREEFTAVLHTLDASWTAEKVQKMVDLADSDKDGKIAYEEFVGWAML